MDVLAVTADCTVELETERAEQSLEVTEADRASGRGEKLLVEFGGVRHD
jgi:hypothetical protein